MVDIKKIRKQRCLALPILASEDALNLGVRNIEYCSKFFMLHLSSSTQTAYFGYVSIREFCGGITLTGWLPTLTMPGIGSFGPRDRGNFLDMRHSPFADSIMQIINVCSEKQVIGPDASRGIAVVANKKPVRDRTVVQFIRKAVCVNTSIAIPEGAVVPPTGMRACPQPTGVRFLNLRPESGNDLLCYDTHRSALLYSVGYRRALLALAYGLAGGVRPTPCRLFDALF